MIVVCRLFLSVFVFSLCVCFVMSRCNGINEICLNQLYPHKKIYKYHPQEAARTQSLQKYKLQYNINKNNKLLLVKTTTAATSALPPLSDMQQIHGRH